MAVIVYAENWSGKFKKSTFEALSYAHVVAENLSTSVVALVIGKVATEDLNLLSQYGASTICHVDGTNHSTDVFSSQLYARIIADTAIQHQAKCVIFSHTYTGKNCAGRVAAILKAGLVTGAIETPTSVNPFMVQKKCFSGKGLAMVTVNTPVAVISITPNSFKLIAKDVPVKFESSAYSPSGNFPQPHLKEIIQATGKIPLTEAELVISAGRGMKGAENWGMIEELAIELNAATACSKPVSDIGWRPHEEHVGQTGITIGPNLYVAIGISGAIQHLAGVSSSKTIVVINSDAEAPFFKAADYGVVGDAFEVVPRLIQSLRKFKSSHN